MNNYSFTKTYIRNPNKKIILVVDDDKSIRFILRKLLEKNGYEVESTGNYNGLLRLIKQISPDLLITDIRLPDGNVLNNLPEIKKIYPTLPIVVISAFSTLATAVNSVKFGAFEYLSKPFDIENVLKVVKSVFDLPKTISENKINSEISSVQLNYDLIGKSISMLNIYSSISKLIDNNLTVFINGETGTGKNLLAKTIHRLSNENENFFRINISGCNFENFKKKLYEIIKNNSTIYVESLDEINLEKQLKFLDLLRAIFKKINNEKINNLRFIVSSRKNIPQLLQNGLFREDLFYFLNIIPINLPPLKERKGDIKELVLNFLDRNKNLPLKEFDQSSFEELKKYNWPGNVKELENFIKRIVVLYPEKKITSLFVSNELTKSRELLNNKNNDFSETLDLEFDKFFNQVNFQEYSGILYDYFNKNFEKSLIKRTLLSFNGNQIKASKLLGINRNTLRKKINELRINIIKEEKN
jgi:two-component system nitrogen regulation response regulator GlnG